MPIIGRSKTEQPLIHGESAKTYISQPDQTSDEASRTIRREWRRVSLDADPRRQVDFFSPYADYYTAKIVHALFPEHSIKVKGVKLPKTKEDHVNTYSDYVEPDQTRKVAIDLGEGEILAGTVEEVKQEFYNKYVFPYHNEQTDEATLRAKGALFDSQINQQFPQVLELAQEMARAGIQIAHPEMNFAIDTKGQVVFIEFSIDNFQTIRERINSARDISEEERKKLLNYAAKVEALEQMRRPYLDISGIINGLAGQSIKATTESSLNQCAQSILQFFSTIKEDKDLKLTYSSTVDDIQNILREWAIIIQCYGDKAALLETANQYIDCLDQVLTARGIPLPDILPFVRSIKSYFSDLRILVQAKPTLAASDQIISSWRESLEDLRKKFEDRCRS